MTCHLTLQGVDSHDAVQQAEAQETIEEILRVRAGECGGLAHRADCAGTLLCGLRLWAGATWRWDIEGWFALTAPGTALATLLLTNTGDQVTLLSTFSPVAVPIQRSFMFLSIISSVGAIEKLFRVRSAPDTFADPPGCDVWMVASITQEKG